ncbi:hypothetical protein KCTC32516_02231 [Polaribacter huanghezhanensis]|uniref:hypothetical protein n=1 Tax=Polaribacter huanghezhanensis TaxID=1354726 RepID=UPI002647B000|nr:hypothetical protein [Polaribacter huanghezhanensis]WKD86851.1 hypothetical protein KCTC32516_02231 [Polaribacter huanghezhanensis]
MKLSNTFLLIIVFFLFSCDKKNNEKVIVFNVVTNKKFNLSLSIKNKDTIIDYKYLSKEKIKNLGFRYYIKKDVLVGEDIFFFKNKKVNYKNIDFKLYGLSAGNGLVSHPGMIFFNKEYGILANATYGASFLFLKDSISKLEREQLFNKIISKIEE